MRLLVTLDLLLIMRVGSTFTGVGGADLGFEAAGMTISWQCELDAWKRSVLAAHWPDVPIYEDVTTLEDPEPVDLMVGGFPCQDLSIAGQRKGFSGERSVLAFEFLRIAESLKPRWLVLENVPGLLSSNKGLDFQRLLREMVASGYGGIAWRCLDARYFGVPQRRRRIFIVARRAEAGLDPRSASGLALRALCESGSGDLTSCIPPWQDTSRTVGGSTEEGRIVGALSARGYTQYTDQEFVRGGQLVTEHDTIAFGHTQGIDIQPSEKHTPTLRVGGGGAGVAYSIREDAKANTFSATEIEAARCLQKQQPSVQSHHAQTFIAETASTLQGSGGCLRGFRNDAESAAGWHLPLQDSIVRRLCPTECEALMGWPRNWTAPEGVKASDSRRYAACGDGIVANVAFWIGQRIMQIDKETHA